MSRRTLLISACAAWAGVPMLAGCAGTLGVVTYPGAASGERMTETPPDASRSRNLQAFDPAPVDRELRALVSGPAAPWAQVSGVAVREGQVVYSGHFGRRFIHPRDRSQDLPVQERTLFRVASISKLVVSVAVMRLVDQGKLDLDADVSEVLGWPLRHPQFPKERISLRLLMTHRSGLSDAAGYAWGVDTALRDVLVPGGRLFGTGAAWRQDRAPGHWFSYVNLNWGVIGTVMERATGERFDRLMSRLLLQPLGLRGGFQPAGTAADLAAQFPAEVADDIATLYRKRRTQGEQEIWEPDGPWLPQVDERRPGTSRSSVGLAHYVPGTNGTLFSPQGGLRISAIDLATLMQMLLNGGRHRGQELVSAAALAELSREQWRFDPAQPNGDTLGDSMLSWALGPQRFTDASGPGRGDRLVEGGGLTGWGHLGDAYGLLASIVLDPVRRHGMVTILGSPSRDPQLLQGRWSSMARDEERVMTAVWSATWS
jgi:CubicO group peptidase (beta-lactamase class C family)